MNVVGKKGFLRLCILAVLPVLVSCVRTGIVSGVPVTYARPDRISVLYRHGWEYNPL